MSKEKKFKEPSGFTCECGTFHVFSVYVFAHWNDALIHTCDKCGAKHRVLDGEAELVEKGKAKL